MSPATATAERETWLFRLAALAAGGLFWINSHPPMIDVPQHAGQVSLLLDLLAGGTPRTAAFNLNPLTPYWLGYGLWTLLACVMPLMTALKVLLTLTYWLYIATAVTLRKACRADPRLDWLLLPAFFGFAFKWGFLTFLMAAPLTLFMLTQSRRHATTQDAKASRLLLGGLLLFCAHALAFLYWLACSYLMLAFGKAGLRARAEKWAPLLALTLLPPLYYLLFQNNTINQQITSSQAVFWKSESSRHLEILLYPYGDNGNSSLEICVFLLLLISPLLLGLRPRLRTIAAIPLLVIVMLWFTAPDYAMKTNFLYERFSLLAIPAYLLLFRAAPPPRMPATGLSEAYRRTAGCFAPVLALGLLAMQGWHFTRFEAESRSFRQVLASIPAHGRLLAIIQDKHSLAARNRALYVNFGSWYQAERGGVSDFNFAWFPPQPVRFRKEALPAISPRMPWNESRFDWTGVDPARYDYVLTRRAPGQPELLPASLCARTLSTHGGWRALARIPCASR